MQFPSGGGHRKNAKQASETHYDIVIVGAGVAGVILADELSKARKRVLIIEAGAVEDATLRGYEKFLHRFYAAAQKDNQSPYPDNPNAPMPRSTNARKITPGQPDASSYVVQTGPYASDTTYTRIIGGTTMHWEGKIMRMLPEDFEMRTRFGQSENWPIPYGDLESYYQKAERELGVSAEVDEQEYSGVKFPPDYVYPMHRMPLSYLDQQVDAGIRDTSVDLYGESYKLRVRSFPQARNGIPNPKYDGGKGYVPVGAVSTNQVEIGERCQGNNNCVPLCPAQAKYNANKTLAKALLRDAEQNEHYIHVLGKAVASKVCIDPDNGRVSHIEVKCYEDPGSPHHHTVEIRGTIFVLAANAVENARLMLASMLPSSSGLVGRNYMDHAYLLSWGLMPQVCGTGRGTNVTGGIVELRGGSFRSRQAAFSVDIHNDGWGWATGAPHSDLQSLVDDENVFGPALKRQIADRVTRQLLLAFMIEVLPNANNRVSVDPRYTDQLGNMRPVISYTIPEYTKRGAAYARQFARLMFQRLGAADHTKYDPEDYGYVTYEGAGYVIRGGNHLSGTHIMGTSKNNSVVDANQRSWNHENLYLIGSGSMPTIGTSNTTLTLSALVYKSAEAIIKHLA